ncbi:alpha-L-glutamate ligases, RimK family [Cronobacter turicensis 564]|nr:alpha-L-glutamate ligases, RimK family [Cronobacter turicensis 564]
MREAHQFKLRAFGFAQHGVIGDVDALHHALKQVFRHDQRLTFNLHQHIVDFSMQRDSAVRRQRPRGGGPDNQRYRAVNGLHAEFRRDRRSVYRIKGDVDGRRRFVVILHLRFSERGAAVDTPVHRLGAFVQMAVADDFTERANDVGFGFEIHGQVRVRPVAQHAQTDKVFTLAVDLSRRVFTAFGAEFGRGEFLTRLAKLLFHFQLDRQAMAVPARHVRRVITGKPFGLHDNVFQNLVNRVTNMNAAIRIRRAIMQNEGFFAFFGCTNDAVQVIIGPTRQHSRFALSEIAAHREPCFRQIQG